MEIKQTQIWLTDDGFPVKEIFCKFAGIILRSVKSEIKAMLSTVQLPLIASPECEPWNLASIYSDSAKNFSLSF